MSLIFFADVELTKFMFRKSLLALAAGPAAPRMPLSNIPEVGTALALCLRSFT